MMNYAEADGNKILADDDLKTAVIKLCDGNPGALQALVAMSKASPVIDVGSMLEEFTPLVMLDELKIYGSDIWVLFKDICGQDVEKALALLRGFQLDFVAKSEIQKAIKESRKPDGFRINVDAVLIQVRTRLDPDWIKPTK